MKLETFFEKFALFADAPDAGAKMRELVLELAVQGKLSEHRFADAKDSSWLKLAQQLDADSSAARSHIEQPFEIPSWWRWTTLERLGDTKPRNDAQDNAKSSFVPMKLIPAEYGQSAQHEERPWGEIKKGYTHFQNGDVVMAKITPCFENGKSAVMQGMTGGFGAGTTELHVFRRSCEGVLPEFVIIYLKTRGFITRGIPRMTGSAGQKRVPSAYFARSPFPLPPLAEQKRIVAKVDELMALCDRLEAQQQEREQKHAALARASLARFADAPTPANLNLLFHSSFNIHPSSLRQSILTLAVQGKLVPQDPNDEPAASLISQIAEEKRSLVAARIIRDKEEAAPITDDELPFEVPYGWEWTRLSSLTRRIHYGYTASAKSELKDVRLLRITDIQNNFVDWPSVPGCEIAKADVAQYQLERGDILVARTGGTVGKTYLVQDVPVVAVFASYLIRIQGGSSLFDRYIKLFLESPTYWVQLEEGARGAAQPNVNGQTLGRMVVSLPPLAEQRRIVAKVDQLMALVDELEVHLAASRATAANLLSALVAELTVTSKS